MIGQTRRDARLAMVFVVEQTSPPGAIANQGRRCVPSRVLNGCRRYSDEARVSLTAFFRSSALLIGVACGKLVVRKC